MNSLVHEMVTVAQVKAAIDVREQVRAVSRAVPVSPLIDLLDDGPISDEVYRAVHETMYPERIPGSFV